MGAFPVTKESRCAPYFFFDYNGDAIPDPFKQFYEIPFLIIDAVSIVGGLLVLSWLIYNSYNYGYK